jgi:hypothetical protein
VVKWLVPTKGGQGKGVGQVFGLGLSPRRRLNNGVTEEGPVRRHSVVERGVSLQLWNRERSERGPPIWRESVGDGGSPKKG